MIPHGFRSRFSREKFSTDPAEAVDLQLTDNADRRLNGMIIVVVRESTCGKYSQRTHVSNALAHHCLNDSRGRIYNMT